MKTQKKNKHIKINQLLNINSWKEKLFQKVSPQTLSIFRIILGAGLLYEANRIRILIPKYYLNPELYIKWDFFPNIPIFEAQILYLFSFILIVTSVMILIGFLFRLATAVYLVLYIYFILAEASYYNNHYYLISLFLFLIMFTKADEYLSIRHFINKKIYKKEAELIPAWNYFLLCFQIFITYFIAGIVKLNFDWISTNTFRCVMQYGTEYPKDVAFYHSEIGIYILTFGGLLFDLIVPLILLSKRLRIIAIPVVLSFHAINAATLNIGVFPYLMAGCTIIFFRNDLVDYWIQLFKPNSGYSFIDKLNDYPKSITNKGNSSKTIFYMIIFYCVLQIIIPFRHILIPGNVGWTGEGNNFAWRMKMGLKAPSRFELYVHNKYTGKEYKPSININPHQFSSLWICPTRITQIAKFVGTKTAKQFNISIDSLSVSCKTDLVFNNHPPTPIFDTTLNLLDVKINKHGHSDFLTKEPYPLPKEQYYWLSVFY